MDSNCKTTQQLMQIANITHTMFQKGSAWLNGYVKHTLLLNITKHVLLYQYTFDVI